MCRPAGKSPAANRAMWGDYHALELALLLQRMGQRKRYYTFFI